MKGKTRYLLLAATAILAMLLLASCSLTPVLRLRDFSAGESQTPADNALNDTADAAEEGDTVTLTRSEYDRLERYASLDLIAREVEAYYYIEPDTDAMMEGAKRGLLAGLGDPYTYYYSPEEFSAMEEEDKGEYAGVGIQISASYETLQCTITRVFSDSPAAMAGIRKGDILTKVDTLDVNASTLNDAVNIMRGEVGQNVHIQVLRADKLLDFDLPRAVVHVNWVSSRMLDSRVGYLLLYEFAGDCALRFTEQVHALAAQGAQALVIDLRDNPGGWVDDAVQIADLFLPKETVTYLEYRDGEREYYDATDGALTLPLVVLMNENSASASEILAGALQDYGVASVVGTQSFGKGIVQFVLPLGSDGAGMQLTAAQYYTPSGRTVHKVGITPDVPVPMPEGDTTLYELGDLQDLQLSRAYAVALSMLQGAYTAPATAAPAATGDTAAVAAPRSPSGAADAPVQEAENSTQGVSNLPRLRYTQPDVELG